MAGVQVLSQRSGTIRRLGPSLAAACADIACGAHELSGADPDDWLAAVAALVLADVERPSIVSIGIVEPLGTDGWETRHFALAGAPRPELATRLEREAREGYPHDDVSIQAGHRGENPRPSCGTRREIVSDDAWYRSAYGAFRRPLGLHEFVRAVVPFREIGAARTLLMQIDLMRAGASPGQWEVGLGEGVAPAIARAYHARFIRLREHREAVLARLTPAQRRVTLLLVEGHSETQVGAAIGRSAHTIHDHTKTIYQSLGVSNRLQLRDLWFGRREAAGRGRGERAEAGGGHGPGGDESGHRSATGDV